MQGKTSFQPDDSLANDCDSRCFRQNVVVVGGKNSAAEAALDLWRCGAHVTLVHRGSRLESAIKYWVKLNIENWIKGGSIEARFSARVVEIRNSFVVVEKSGIPHRVICTAVCTRKALWRRLAALRDVVSEETVYAGANLIIAKNP